MSSRKLMASYKAMHGRRLLRLITIAFFVSSFIISLSAYGELLDQVIAVVNDDVITYSELERVLEPLYHQYEDSYAGPELFAKLQGARWSMLNQLIEERLVLQEAKKKEMEIEEDVLMKRVEEVESRFSSKEEFQRELARSDMTLEEFREREREKLTAFSILMGEVSKRVIISPQNIISYYHDHEDEYVESEKVYLYQIFIKEGDEAKPRMAEKLLDRLEAGEDFKELAKVYSEGPAKEKGGDWGFIERGYLNPDTMGEIEEVAFKLEAGSHSGIIETPLGYHIVMVEAIKREQVVPVSEMWSEIERKLYEEEAEKVKDEWISGLKKKAYISIKQ